DSTITQLNQAVASDRNNLAAVAQQLGLPKDELAPAPQAVAGGVGGFAPIDQGAISSAEAKAAPTMGKVTSAQDLAVRVNAYLKLPCPLPAGDPRCQQAETHARQEVSRGHGLNVDRPDARPTMDMDIAQPFGPTDVDLEPLQMVDGQLVHFHDGVDLDEDMDQPVMAAANGVVTFAGVIPSGAETIEVTHAGGWKTVYMHEDQLLVNVGDHVQKGQIIGLIGMTGMTTGPHLHFTLQNPSGTAVDPMPFIQ
ncbi:MAG: M23 family metallopeptidase, partial [Chloroflexi bacterium]|nr:M23 family metallopeptidase [Chloroflexota bacterium]